VSAQQGEDANDVAKTVDIVVEVTKNEDLKKVTDKVREFDTKWGTGGKRK
jgi:hypothetical protein